jgi:hypothetical protein
MTNKHLDRLTAIKQCQLDSLTIEETMHKLGLSPRVVEEYWEALKTTTVDDLHLIKNKNRRMSDSTCTTPIEYSRRSLYGLLPEEYNRMFVEQEGRCAICGIHQNDLNISLCYDHNHQTFQPRGLLCSRCNVRLGFIERDMALILRSIEYLNNQPPMPM